MLNRTAPDISHNVPESTLESVNDLVESFRQHALNVSPLGATLEYPKVNVSENGDEVFIEAELPGMDPQDIDLRLQNDTIQIQGEKKHEHKGQYDSFHKIECRYGGFQRTIPLPSEVDEEKVQARYERGVLKLTLPKKEEAKRRRIEIAS